MKDTQKFPDSKLAGLGPKQAAWVAEHFNHLKPVFKDNAQITRIVTP